MSDNPVAAFLTADTHGVPNFAWGIIALGGLGVGIYLKNKSANTAVAATPVIDTSQQTATGVGPIDTSGGIANPVTQNPYPITMTVRSSGLYPKEDAIEHGVAVRFLPSASSPVIYWAPFNSQIVVTGPLVGTWYPVGGAYINEVDVH